MVLLCFLLIRHLHKLYITRFSPCLTSWTHLFFYVEIEIYLPRITSTFYIVKSCFYYARFKHTITGIFYVSHVTISITLYKSQIVAYFKRGYLHLRQIEVLHLMSDKIIHQRHVVNLAYTCYVFWMRYVTEIHVEHFKDHIRIQVDVYISSCTVHLYVSQFIILA